MKSMADVTISSQLSTSKKSEVLVSHPIYENNFKTKYNTTARCTNSQDKKTTILNAVM